MTMSTIGKLGFKVAYIKAKCIRSLTIGLLVYMLGTLGCFGIMVYDYFK